MNSSLPRPMLFFFLVIFNLDPKSRPPLLFPSDEALNPAVEIEKAKTKPKKIPTSWGGSNLTQEVKKINGLDITTYTLGGGAWIQHRKVKLSSSQIEIIGEDAVSGHLKGFVKVEDPENKITFTAEKGEYDKFNEIVTLSGRPTLLYYNQNNKLTKITAPYIKRYLQENKTVLEGGLIMQDEDYTILAEAAIFYDKENSLVMEDSPFIFGKELFLSGEKVTYKNDEKLTILESDTIFAKLSYEAPKKKEADKEKEFLEEEDNKPERRLTFITGNEIKSFTGKSQDESYVGVFGDAKIYRVDSEFKGSYLKASGKDYKNLESKEYVEFLDKENNIKITGKLFEHDDSKNYTHVSEEPKVIFLDKEGNETSNMKTIELERFGELKEIVARGNIKIESEDSIIRGEYATYYEEQKKMIVEGNPNLEREGTIVRSGKIILYPEENRAILAEGLGIKDSTDKKK
ncbi:MAG: hypothetical protein SFU98_05645 [Leptospiraceae bacterium]|nr:hypothetical protein [Leptospiraceae bacterium]